MVGRIFAGSPFLPIHNIKLILYFFARSGENTPATPITPTDRVYRPPPHGAHSAEAPGRGAVGLVGLVGLISSGFPFLHSYEQSLILYFSREAMKRDPPDPRDPRNGVRPPLRGRAAGGDAEGCAVVLVDLVSAGLPFLPTHQQTLILYFFARSGEKRSTRSTRTTKRARSSPRVEAPWRAFGAGGGSTQAPPPQDVPASGGRQRSRRQSGSPLRIRAVAAEGLNDSGSNAPPAQARSSSCWSLSGSERASRKSA